MNPRSEPLLWVQLINLGVLPLELLLLLLVLAGSDPGPLPQLERLLTWALGALAPAILLWRRPADLRSLLLLTSALPKANLLQCTLAACQTTLVPRLLFAAGVLALLPLLGWIDAHAALASQFSPLADGPRLSALLLSVGLVALMVWQWHQLVQATLLLIKGPSAVAGVTPLSPELMAASRRNLGLGLLLLPDLELPQAAKPVAINRPDADTAAVLASHDAERVEPDRDTTDRVEPCGESDAAAPEPPEPSADSEEPDDLAAEVANDAQVPLAGTVAVKPEQTTEQAEGSDLDEEIAGEDFIPGR